MSQTSSARPLNHVDLIREELKKADRLHEKVKRERLTGKSYQRVIRELLAQIEWVDFREKANLDSDEKISRKIYVVLAIDEVIEKATSNNWGLCTKNGFIYVFNGKYWLPVDPEDFKPFLASAAMKMGVPNFDARYHQFKDELYKQFLSCANFQTPEPNAKVLVNLLNGTFEITPYGQELREPRREDFLKYQLPFEYNPKAKCPLFDRYIAQVLPDADCQKVLAEYMGYIFVPDLKLEKAVILYGGGANGKSVFFEVMSAILGEENICSYSLQSLTKEESYERAELQNKLLNYASEINGKLEAATFKQLVSGEPVQARRIYSKPFTMRNYAKLMFNCNELPKEVEQTDAFFRRFIIVPFTQIIPAIKQDPELAKKIINTELSGVFNWILTGLQRLLSQRRFTYSKLIQDQIDSYRRESDSVAMFLDDHGYSPSINEYVLLKSMYGEYKNHCYESGHRNCSIKTFSDRLKKLDYDSKKSMYGVIIYAKK